MLFEITERGTPFKMGEIIEIDNIAPYLVNKGRILANVPAEVTSGGGCFKLVAGWWDCGG